MKPVDNRRAQALRLRLSGYTYREIGEKIGGKTSTRAQQIVNDGAAILRQRLTPRLPPIGGSAICPEAEDLWHHYGPGDEYLGSSVGPEVPKRRRLPGRFYKSGGRWRFARYNIGA